MNLESQIQLPECKTIGSAGMLVCALHPTSTLARAPCFAAEDGRRQTDLAVYVSARAKEIEMNTSLPGYDEQLFGRLKRLAEAMQSGSAESIRLLSQKIRFSSEVGSEVRRIARSLGFSENPAHSYSMQMMNYLQTKTESIEAEEEERDTDNDEVD